MRAKVHVSNYKGYKRKLGVVWIFELNHSFGVLLRNRYWGYLQNTIILW